MEKKYVFILVFLLTLVSACASKQEFATQSSGGESQPYGYQVPVQADSPWPTFRRDHRNTGSAPYPAIYPGGEPWSFHTGKGIFSTPIIDADGVAYVGSADHFFYAINPDGSLKWKFETGEIIDSAGALTAPDPASGVPTITFISGDGKMYHFRADDVPLEERPLWVYQAELRPEVSYNRWFEGNVAVGYDGTLYAGNTNFLYYAINPNGTLKWTYETGSNNWSQAAFTEDGTIFWGSNDTYVRAVDPAGTEKWTKMTLGFIAASAAVGSDGTVYIGSFDSNLYALNPRTGKVKWKFPTRDHIYASVALQDDAQGNTSAIYFGSADGGFYAVDPAGNLLWKYDTGDTIRSSAALGFAPDGAGRIVYFGCGNGKLYALNAEDGSLRWAFNTTSDDSELADRNDLNSSVSLGLDGAYIGGEDGNIWFMPYDYCLNAQDARCIFEEDLPENFTGMYYVTPGGSLKEEISSPLPAATMLTLRLLVREDGETMDARVCNNPWGCPQNALRVSMTPNIPFSVEHSADGRYIYIRPQGFLEPGETYQIEVNGKYYNGGLRLGNMQIGGRPAGDFSEKLSFTVNEAANLQFFTPASAGNPPLLEWSRLAAPIPPMLPSLNQIGFDYIDWVMSPVVTSAPDSSGRGKTIFWALGAMKDPSGELVADPQSDFMLPLSGEYLGENYILANQDFNMPITGINIPFNVFELRGAFNPDLTTQHPAAFADADTLSIPTFGPYLVIAGLANNIYEKLLVAGTFVTDTYSGPLEAAPEGLREAVATSVLPGEKEAGYVQFDLSWDGNFSADAHRAGILLYDPRSIEPVYLDYNQLITVSADENGTLATVKLEIPAGTNLPGNLSAMLILDLTAVKMENLKP